MIVARLLRFVVLVSMPLLLLGAPSAVAEENGEKGAPPQRLNAAFYTYTLHGRSLDDIEMQGRARALGSAVGDLLVEDRFILAPEVLDTYLDARVDKFISGYRVLAVRQSVGSVTADIQVAIDLGKLEKDLEEKRFFYQPKRRPYFHVSIAETLDGAPPPQDFARQAAIESLINNAGRPSKFQIANPPSNLDVDSNQDVLYRALVACRRTGVELLITGTVEATKQGDNRLYYDTYTSYMAKATLKLINVQDGTTLRTVSFDAKANDPDTAMAAELALKRVANDAVNELMKGFLDDWRKRTLDDAPYRLLVREVSEDDLSAFMAQLENLGNDTRVFRKSYLNQIGVLNMYYTGPEAELRRFLGEIRYPKFVVDSFEEGRIRLTLLD